MPLRIVCGDELGSLKVLHAATLSTVESSSLTSWSDPDRSQAIKRIATSTHPSTFHTTLAISRASNIIQLIDHRNGTIQATLPKSDSPSVGLHIVYPTATEATTTITTNNNDTDKPPSQQHKRHRSSSSSSSSIAPLVASVTEKGTASLYNTSTKTIVSTWSTPPNVECTALHPHLSSLAAACKGTELRIYDIATGTQTYAAKGGKPDKVGLVDKPHNTAIAFLTKSSNADDDGRQHVLVGTHKHKVRLYDPAAGKRPQMDLSFGETRITAIAPEPGSDGNRCWVATGMGQLEVLDMRAGKFMGAIRGIAGSIRGLKVSKVSSIISSDDEDSDRNVIVSVGLDRWLRVHDCSTRALLGKVYVKTQMNSVDFLPGGGGGGGGEEGEEKKERRKKKEARE